MPKFLNHDYCTCMLMGHLGCVEEISDEENITITINENYIHVFIFEPVFHIMCTCLQYQFAYTWLCYFWSGLILKWHVMTQIFVNCIICTFVCPRPIEPENIRNKLFLCDWSLNFRFGFFLPKCHFSRQSHRLHLNYHAYCKYA